MNIQPVPAQIFIQQTYEEGFHDGYRQAMREMPEIVRCKDCKHYDETQRGKPKGKNRYYVCDNFNPEDDWFCADGERRTDDA